MERAKDELTGIVMAHGSPDAVASTIGNPSRGELTSITSDSTRRDGVVTSMDVAATVEAYLGRPASGGATIRLDPSPAPFDLHARYLADRRLSVPVQTGAGIYVTLVGLFGAVVVVRKSPVPAWARRVAALGAMSLFPLAAFLLLVGHASTLSYTSVVVVIVAGVSASLVAIDRIAAVGGPVVAAGAVGLAVLALFAIEAALGWTAALTPLLGGSELDGGRFYGLPNVDIGLLLGAAVLFAAWIQRPLIGAAAVGAVGLFAGLPWTGSNLGGAVTLFAAAGLWYGTCRTGRLGLRSIGGAAVAATVGTIVVLAAHRYLSTFPTHIGEFLRGESGGLLAKVADRIAVGIDLIGRNPFALVPVLGVVACAAVVLRPPPKLASAFGTGPVWHAAVITILAASVVAYVANDSGPAALGLGFGSAVATVIWASLAERGRKGSERLG
jgi:hypothetical protein